MDFDYSLAAEQLEKADLEIIKNYYNSWNYEGQINLKFRAIKIFTINEKDRNTIWINLHRSINKRRIYNHTLADAIRILIRKGIIPIRIFHSSTEWLAPNEIDSKNKHPTLISSGFLPFECDTSIDESLENARILVNHLPNSSITFSGNKSFHIWWNDFDVSNYIKNKESDRLWNKRFREKFELIARKKAFEEIKSQTPYELDYRISLDTRRVVPIIGTLNGFVKRKVISILSDDLKNYSTDKFLSISNLS